MTHFQAAGLARVSVYLSARLLPASMFGQSPKGEAAQTCSL